MGIGSRSVKVTGRRQSAWWPKGWRYRWTSPWNGAVGLFFGNTELSLELWTVISGISGFDYS